MEADDVKWRQFSQSNRHSTIGTRQTEYHEALPSSANVQSHLTSSFADDGNASWYSHLSSADGGMTAGLWKLPSLDGRRPPWYRPLEWGRRPQWPVPRRGRTVAFTRLGNKQSHVAINRRWGFQRKGFTWWRNLTRSIRPKHLKHRPGPAAITCFKVLFYAGKTELISTRRVSQTTLSDTLWDKE